MQLVHFVHIAHSLPQQTVHCHQIFKNIGKIFALAVKLYVVFLDTFQHLGDVCPDLINNILNIFQGGLGAGRKVSDLARNYGKAFSRFARVSSLDRRVDRQDIRSERDVVYQVQRGVYALYSGLEPARSLVGQPHGFRDLVVCFFKLAHGYFVFPRLVKKLAGGLRRLFHAFVQTCFAVPQLVQLGNALACFSAENIAAREKLLACRGKLLSETAFAFGYLRKSFSGFKQISRNGFRRHKNIFHSGAVVLFNVDEITVHKENEKHYSENGQNNAYYAKQRIRREKFVLYRKRRRLHYKQYSQRSKYFTCAYAYELKVKQERHYDHKIERIRPEVP